MKLIMKNNLLFISLLTAVLISSCASSRIVVPPVTTKSTGVHHAGKFVWHDLLTNDVSAVKKFYAALFGWKFNNGSDEYTTILKDSLPIGGIVYVEDLENEINSSQWMSYLSVDDVDKSVDFIKQNGGTVLRETHHLEGRGRFAVVQDAQGALLALLRADGGDPPDEEPATFGWLWNELLTTDVESAVPFYEAFAGFTSESTELTKGHNYYILKNDGKLRAGVVQVPWKEVRTNWLPYILVDDPAALVSQVKDLGGEIILPPSDEIRKGSVALIADPSGAVLAIQKWPFQ